MGHLFFAGFVVAVFTVAAVSPDAIPRLHLTRVVLSAPATIVAGRSFFPTEKSVLLMRTFTDFAELPCGTHQMWVAMNQITAIEIFSATGKQEYTVKVYLNAAGSRVVLCLPAAQHGEARILADGLRKQIADRFGDAFVALGDDIMVHGAHISRIQEVPEVRGPVSGVHFYSAPYRDVTVYLDEAGGAHALTTRSHQESAKDVLARRTRLT